MAAYRTAARLFPGLHQPLLGMGCEYARMNNQALAQQILLSAHAVCPQVCPPPLRSTPTPGTGLGPLQSIALSLQRCLSPWIRIMLA